MAKKIDQPIVDFRVLNETSENNDKQPANEGRPAHSPSIQTQTTHTEKPLSAGTDTSAAAAASSSATKPQAAEIIQMHEKVDRPSTLLGATYKIKTPLSDHALYVTINDIVLNQDTDHELRRPFEIFINSKNMDHFQWVVALTRVISAVFRKGGDCTFLVEELKAVFDPQGGYFKKGGKFMPSLVAEIGYAIESHLKMIGLLKTEELSEHQQQILTEKRNQYEAAASNNAPSDDDNPYPNGAKLCGKCHTKAMIMLDGCMTCLSCGDSKCS